MKYITFADFAATIRQNFAKVPHDVDFVVGVPRSGVIAGGIIAEYLNIPLIDVDSFAFGAKPTGGRRMKYHISSGRLRPRVLVVDDTVYHGQTMEKTREKLKPFAGRYEFIYMAVYREGPYADVDLWLEDVRPSYGPDGAFALYEWNIFHHLPKFMSECIYDIDGVLCAEPPDDRTEQPYREYIGDAVPLFIPSSKVGELVTYRIEANEVVTRQWLDRRGIQYDRLTMFPARTREERGTSGTGPARFKAEIYAARSWARLFVESNDHLAQKIASLTGKMVYCVETNKLYH